MMPKKPEMKSPTGREKSTSKSPSRGPRSVSKSPARLPKSASKSNDRSASHSRVTSKAKRTPASESKIKRRRSPSSSESDTSEVVQIKTPSASTSKATGDLPTVLLTAFDVRERTPTRVSQRITKSIERIQSNPQQREGYYLRHERVEKKSLSNARPVSSLAQARDRCTAWCYKHIIMSPLLAAVNLCAIVPFAFWINLLVFAPAPTGTTGNISESVKRLHQTYWGPGYAFARVIWPTDWRAYLDPWATVGAIAYLFLHFLIARFVPFGRLVASIPGSRHKDYRCNGIVSLLLFLALFAGSQYFGDKYLHGVKPSTLLPKYWLTFMTVCAVVGVDLSIYAYVTGRRTSVSEQPPGGNSGNFFIDFWNGRSTRLHVCNLDMKMFSIRPGLVALALFDLAFLCAQWERYSRVSPALALLTTMHLIIVLDFFAFEHTHLFSYESFHQGVGVFYTVGVFLIPYYYNLASSYVSLRPDIGRVVGSPSAHSCDAWAMGFAASLFLVGLWIRRAADNQKDRFRRDPYHPTLITLDTVVGPGGRRLLAGGWWGIVRHPNYFGEILTYLAQGVACGFTSWIPWVIPCFIVMFLLHRCCSNEWACAQKHGGGWIKYTNLVTKRLIPKVW